jgi:branched-chain amino acid transport system permease protein
VPENDGSGERSRVRLDRFADDATTRRVAGFVVATAALAFAVLVSPIPAPLGVILNGVLVGGRVALIALGIALVYRANRVVNFAQGDLGAVPASLAVLLIISTGVPYILAFFVGLAAAIVLGVLVETLIIRRFFRAPRLILTVATIGLAQLLVGAGLFLPQLFDGNFVTDRISPPFTANFSFGGTIFNANDIVTMIVVPTAFFALAFFMQRSSIGIAVRAAAERADRATTLGIPVKRLHTYVWVIATVLAFLAMFLRAGAVGLPIGSVLGPSFLLQALAAAVIGRMEHFPTIAFAAIGLGIIDQAMTFQPGNNPAFNDAVLFVIILVALLVTQRPSANRVDADSVSTWQAAREVRPIPRELAGLPEVRYARWALGFVIAVVLLTLPLWLSVSQVNLAAVIVIFGIVGISLVVLTGWAGQVSLGQMAFVGIGAAVGGGITANQGWDLGFALLIGGAAGALVAVVIGYPSLRRRGLTLAVTTLAFALVTWSYLLNREFFAAWLPPQRLERPALFGAIDITSETAYYFLSLAGLAIALVLVRGLRNSRTGRVLIGIRENERAARSYGVNASRTTLAAFAISGFLAAFAGVLFVHHQTGLIIDAYAPEESLRVFSMVVIGGLGSVPGALLGSFYVRGTQYFLPAEWQFLASGAGLLLVLMIFPGGLGAVLYEVRDWYLRKVAERRQLIVPSLVADQRVEEPAAPIPEAAFTAATHAAEDAHVPETLP